MQKTEKQKNKGIPPFIRILISAILVFAVWQSAQVLVLSFSGETTLGVITSYNSRLDDRHAQANRSRTISKGYSFTVNGREYKGYVIYSSDEAWPDLGENEVRRESISYLAFLPYVNKPTMLVDLDEIGPIGLLYHVSVIPGCTLLFLLANGYFGKRKKRVKKRKSTEKLNSRGEHTVFCTNCGKKLPEGAVFCAGCGAQVQKSLPPDICRSCGAKLPEKAAFCTNCGTPVQEAKDAGKNTSGQVSVSSQRGASLQSRGPSQSNEPSKGNFPSQKEINLVGWSERSNDPEILEAARKNKKSAIGCAWILLLLFPAGFIVAGLLIEEMPLGEAVVIGVALGLFTLVINLWRLKDLKGPIWEGVVTQKYNKERREHNRDDDSMTTYTEFTTVIKKDTGKENRIVERDSRRHMYDYLTVGDRVRYHPAFGTYEKYDKSKDRIIYCNVCFMMNPITNDRCKRCNKLLFK